MSALGFCEHCEEDGPTSHFDVSGLGIPGAERELCDSCIDAELAGPSDDRWIQRMLERQAGVGEPPIR